MSVKRTVPRRLSGIDLFQPGHVSPRLIVVTTREPQLHVFIALHRE